MPLGIAVASAGGTAMEPSKPTTGAVTFTKTDIQLLYSCVISVAVTRDVLEWKIELNMEQQSKGGESSIRIRPRDPLAQNLGESPVCAQIRRPSLEKGSLACADPTHNG